MYLFSQHAACMDSMRRSQLTVVNLKELMHSLGLYLKMVASATKASIFKKKKKEIRQTFQICPLSSNVVCEIRFLLFP